MSRSHYKKHNFHDSSEVSEDRGYVSCEQGHCNDQRGYIICPPYEHREKYESEYSDYSCPDFSALCEDKPRICCEKKDPWKKKEATYLPSSSSDSKYRIKGCKGCRGHCDSKNKCNSCKSCNCDHCSDKSSSESGCKGCRGYCDSKNKCNSCKSCTCDNCTDKSSSDSECGGCGGHCDHRNKCDSCKSCGCRECSDYSRSSVLSSLGDSESKSECPKFDDLARDRKKKCIDIRKHHSEPLYRPGTSAQKQTMTPKIQSRNTAVGNNQYGFSQSLVRPHYSNQSNEKKELIHSDSTEKKESSASSSSKGKKFIVTFGPKSGHQWAEYQNGDKSIHINGKNGPVLHLYRGCSYFFCVEQTVPAGEDPEHSLILTNNPSGGQGSRMIPNSFSPVPRGCVCLKVDETTPRYFFYHDYKNPFAGGLVIVHDK